MKRVISILLVVVMLCSTFAGLQVTSAAEDLPASGSCGTNVTYTFDSATGELVISGTGAMKDYYSPPYCPFYNQTGILYIIIKSGVTSIGNYAFDGCSSLTSVTIPDSITSIGDCAFSGCSGLTSITIPNSVTSIAFLAFSGCTSLTSIIIPNSVTSIGAWAFNDCSSLTSVTIPDSVTSIGHYAFYGCSGLTSVTIPDSVISIGDDAFLRTSYYSTSSNWVNDVLYIGNHLIEAKDSLSGEYTVKSGTKTIADDAFDDCTCLTSITIPDSVIRIGEDAFQYCRGLTSIIIPDSVTSIGSDAFYYCTGLKSIAIPDSVTGRLYAVFFGCRGLTSVTIGNGVTSLGRYAFEDCTCLTSITIPDSVTSIGERTFKDCSRLTSVTIGNGVTSIGKQAFYGCSSLSDVYYTGTREQWKRIIIGNDNYVLEKAKIHYLSRMSSISSFYHFDYENVHKDKTIPVRFDVGIYQDAGKKTNMDIKWDYSMFNKSSAIADNDLAIASLVLSANAYDLGMQKETLQQFGFSNNRIKDYNYDDWDDDPNRVANTIASTVQTIGGKKTNVIVIACKGTSNNIQEKFSNYFQESQGFRFAAKDIKEDFENYIQGKNEYGISFGKDFGGKIDTSLPTKILITGHSRGAAAANILATIIPSYIAKKSDIFTYTFACPNTTNDAGRENYNIFNILNAGDPVTQMPIIYDACPRFGAFNIWFDKATAKNFNYYFTALTGLNDVTYILDFPISWCNGSFGPEIMYAVRHHTIAVYMAFLLGEGIESNSNNNFNRKRISIECPVDISVYDSTGKLLGRIKDNVADDNLLKNGIIPVIEGDKKYLYTTSDKEIVLKLTGSDSGQMKYTVSDIDVNTGEVSNKKEFSGISLENNKTMLSEINVDTATQDTKLLVTNNDSIVKEIDDNGTETDAVVITFDTKEGDYLRDVVIQKGTAPGALPEAKLNGYQFAGWYTDEECKNAFDNTAPLNESITLYAAYTQSQAVFAGINSFTYDGSELKAEIDFEYNHLNGQLVTVLCKDGKMIACKYSSVSENDTQTAVTIPVSGLSGLYSLKLYSLDSNGELKPAGKALEYDTAFYADYLYAGNKDAYAANAAVPELTKNGNTIAPSNTVVDNYVFKGWFTGETFANQFDFDSAAPENITLYAKWDFADDWDEPFYTWAKDYSTCTASRINTLNPNVVQRETVDVMVQSTATCTSAGEADFTTLPFENAAFEVQTKRMAVGAAGHKESYPVTENEHAATCTEAGSYESVIYCSVCGEEMSREKVDVNALGHDFSDNAEVCRRGCGTANPDYIPPVPAHVHDYQEVVTAPKANAFGYTQYKCACGEWQTDESGEVIKDNYTSPTGKVTGLKCTARTAAAMKFTWKKVSGVRGYQVQLINAKGAQAGLKTLHENVYTFIKLASGHAYKARVRLYVKDADGKYYFGPWSAVLTSPTLPKGTALTGLARAKKAFTAKWKKGACTGYQLQFGRKANFAGANTVTFKNVKTVKYTAKKLAAKKYYFVRIRTYKKIAGKNYFSAWSKTYKVKTK